MSCPFVIAANWKMHKNPAQAETFFSDLKGMNLSLGDKELLFFVPAVNLATTGESCKDTAWGWGSQNSHFEKQGAFTGETSPEVIAQMGATHGLVGHSERRQMFFEDGPMLAKKMEALLVEKVVPVLCIGESLEQRKSGVTLATLKTQLSEALALVGKDEVFHVAYEPVWAIGTGEVADAAQIAEAHGFIRGYLNENFSKASDIAILYGGSVKPANCEELSQVENVGGFLIGSAALTVESFGKIVQVSKP